MPTRVEKDGDGYKAVITVPGRPDQIFKGKNYDEVIFQLGKAQEEASKKILEQRLALKTTKAAVDPLRESVTFEPKPMSAIDQMAIGKDFADPAKAKSAFDKMVEATFGAPPEKLRSTLTRAQDLIEREENVKQAREFTANHTDYKQTPENEKKMLDYLASHDMGFTAGNLAIAYEELKEFLDLKDLAAAQPPVPPPAPTEEIPQPQARPRAAMTGLPGGKAVASPSTNRPGVLTDEEFMQEVHRLSTSQYREKLGNPAFRARVDKIAAQRQAPRTQ
jgi:hypothetical protein